MNAKELASQINQITEYQLQQKDWPICGRICKLYSTIEVEKALSEIKLKKHLINQPVLKVWQILSNNKASKKAGQIMGNLEKELN